MKGWKRDSEFSSKFYFTDQVIFNRPVLKDKFNNYIFYSGDSSWIFSSELPIEKGVNDIKIDFTLRCIDCWYPSNARNEMEVKLRRKFEDYFDPPNTDFPNLLDYNHHNNFNDWDPMKVDPFVDENDISIKAIKTNYPNGFLEKFHLNYLDTTHNKLLDLYTKSKNKSEVDGFVGRPSDKQGEKTILRTPLFDYLLQISHDYEPDTTFSSDSSWNDDDCEFTRRISSTYYNDFRMVYSVEFKSTRCGEYGSGDDIENIKFIFPRCNPKYLDYIKILYDNYEVENEFKIYSDSINTIFSSTKTSILGC